MGAAYWRGEQAAHPGADVGLTATQLFAYWQTRGIAGTMLTSATPVPLSGVEAHLTDVQALLATAELPAGFPASSAKPSAHAWLVVGISGYGPIVVTWGEAVQLSWVQFDAWTSGLWAITATAP